MFPSGLDGNVPCHIWVPIDDNNTLSWGIDWHPLRAFTREEKDASVTVSGGGATYLSPSSRPHGHWYTEANAANDYLLDREVQRKETFSGIPTVALQDTAVTESMGATTPREREHLGTSDSMIIRTRRRLIAIARALRDEGTPPPGVDQPEMFRVRSAAVHLPRDVSWREALADWHAARAGLPQLRVPIT